MVCVVLSLFTLSACSAAEAEAEPLDEQFVSEMCQAAEQDLTNITKITADQVEVQRAAALKKKSTVEADGIAAWGGVMGDTGSLVQVVSGQAAEMEDGSYACTLTADFANRRVEFKVFYEEQNGLYVPVSYSFAPEYTTGEKLAKAAMNTAMGMGTVFMVLIFISILISCFKYISVFENRAKTAAAPAPAAPSVPTPAVSVEEEELVDDLELVAVITAAIAAFDNTSADGLVVRSIKRAPGAKWKRA